MTKTVPLVDMNALPEDLRDLLERLPQLNIFKMVAHLPTSLKPFTELAKSILQDGDIELRLLEIGILRVAYLTASVYQSHQHETIAKSIGMTEREISIIRSDGIVNDLNPEENFICKIADELTSDVNLKEETFKELFSHYSNQQAITIILCISFYNMVSRFLKATRVPIEKNNPLEGKSFPIN
jgi:4-carboxymuconolactone decarboxylase